MFMNFIFRVIILYFAFVIVNIKDLINSKL